MKRNRTLPLIIFLFIIFALFSCSESPKNNDLPDTEPPAIVSVTPADGSEKVSILTDIQIVFTESLDADSVNETNIKLIAYSKVTPSIIADYELIINILYDNNIKAIIIDPEFQLYYKTEYEIILTGVSDHAGNVLPDTTISFNTYINPIVRSITYDSGEIDFYTIR